MKVYLLCVCLGLFSWEGIRDFIVAGHRLGSVMSLSSPCLARCLGLYLERSSSCKYSTSACPSQSTSEEELVSRWETARS